MKKILALHPDVREEECDHRHTPWSGAIPCTGRQVCTMCGAEQLSQSAWDRLHPDRKTTMQDGTLAYTRRDHSGATVLVPCFLRD